MKKILTCLALLTTVAISANTASAADPTTFGAATIGTIPGASDWGGFWRTGLQSDPWNKYSLLTNGTNTYINAPQANGTIFFRGNNTASNGAADPDGWTSRMYIDRFSNLYVGSDIHASRTLYAGSAGSLNAAVSAQSGGIAVYGQSSNNTGVWGTSTSYHGVFGQSGSGTGVFGTSDSGVAAWFVGYNSYALRTESDRGVLFLGPLEILGTPRGTAGDLILNGGRAFKSGGGMWEVLSDARVKKDIGDFKSGLADLEKIHVVKFKYNGLGGTKDTGKEYVGVVAQELEQVAPFMIATMQKKLRENDKTPADLKQVDPSAFTYMLVNAVKELSAQNGEQNKKLASLAEQNQALVVQNQKLVELVEQNRLLVSSIEKRLGRETVAVAK